MKLPNPIDRHYKKVAFGFSLLVLICFSIWGGYFNGIDFVNRVLKNNRGPLYGALTGMFGTLLGFVLSAASIVLTLVDKARLARLQKSGHLRWIAQDFFATTWILGISTLAMLFVLIRDTEAQPWFVGTCVAVFFGLWSGLMLFRCIRLMEQVVLSTMEPEPPSTTPSCSALSANEHASGNVT